MKILVLLKYIKGHTIIAMYFKNEEKATEWWINDPYSEDWIVIHGGKRKECGHRYELKYSTFSKEGKMLSKYIICYSKKEAVLLARKMGEANSNYYTINIKRLY